MSECAGWARPGATAPHNGPTPAPHHDTAPGTLDTPTRHAPGTTPTRPRRAPQSPVEPLRAPQAGPEPVAPAPGGSSSWWRQRGTHALGGDTYSSAPAPGGSVLWWRQRGTPCIGPDFCPTKGGRGGGRSLAGASAVPRRNHARQACGSGAFGARARRRATGAGGRALGVSGDSAPTPPSTSLSIRPPASSSPRASSWPSVLSSPGSRERRSLTLTPPKGGG